MDKKKVAERMWLADPRYLPERTLRRCPPRPVLKLRKLLPEGRLNVLGVCPGPRCPWRRAPDKPKLRFPRPSRRKRSRSALEALGSSRGGGVHSGAALAAIMISVLTRTSGVGYVEPFTPMKHTVVRRLWRSIWR